MQIWKVRHFSAKSLGLQQELRLGNLCGALAAKRKFPVAIQLCLIKCIPLCELHKLFELEPVVYQYHYINLLPLHW